MKSQYDFEPPGVRAQRLGWKLVDFDEVPDCCLICRNYERGMCQVLNLRVPGLSVCPEFVINCPFSEYPKWDRIEKNIIAEMNQFI